MKPPVKCQCSQCGATDFTRLEDQFLRCVHCDSLFKMLPPPSEKPTITIRSGANVTFGEKTTVTFLSDLIIEEGATVAFLGEIELVQKGKKKNDDGDLLERIS